MATTKQHAHTHAEYDQHPHANLGQQVEQNHHNRQYHLFTRRALHMAVTSRSKRSASHTLWLSLTITTTVTILFLFLALFGLFVSHGNMASAQQLPSFSAPSFPNLPTLGSAPAAPGSLPPLPGSTDGSSGAAAGSSGAGGGESGGGGSSALSTIAFSKDTYSVAANDSIVSIVLLRLGGIDGTASINFTTNDVTAVSGIDYGGGSGFVTWLDGDVNAKVVQIAIERTQPWSSSAPYKRFLLLLYNPVNAYLGYPNIVTVDMAPTPAAPAAPSSTGGSDAVSTGGAATQSSTGSGNTGRSHDTSSTGPPVVLEDDSSRSGTNWQLALGLGLGLGGGGLIILMAMIYGVFQHRKRQRAMQNQVAPLGGGGGGGGGAANGAVRMGGAIASMSRAPSGAGGGGGGGVSAHGRPSINASASAPPNSVIRSVNGGDAAVVIRSA